MFLISLFLAINLVSFLMMYYDKECAKSGAWRVPEKILFEIALFGGGVGGTLGMIWFRHKTKHWYFRYGFPVLAGIQILLILVLIFR